MKDIFINVYYIYWLKIERFFFFKWIQDVNVFLFKIMLEIFIVKVKKYKSKSQKKNEILRGKIVRFFKDKII